MRFVLILLLVSGCVRSATRDSRTSVERFSIEPADAADISVEPSVWASGALCEVALKEQARVSAMYNTVGHPEPPGEDYLRACNMLPPALQRCLATHISQRDSPACENMWETEPMYWFRDLIFKLMTR